MNSSFRYVYEGNPYVVVWQEVRVRNETTVEVSVPLTPSLAPVLIDDKTFLEFLSTEVERVRSAESYEDANE